MTITINIEESDCVAACCGVAASCECDYVSLGFHLQDYPDGASGLEHFSNLNGDYLTTDINIVGAYSGRFHTGTFLDTTDRGVLIGTGIDVGSGRAYHRYFWAIDAAFGCLPCDTGVIGLTSSFFSAVVCKTHCFFDDDGTAGSFGGSQATFDVIGMDYNATSDPSACDDIHRAQIHATGNVCGIHFLLQQYDPDLAHPGPGTGYLVANA